MSIKRIAESILAYYTRRGRVGHTSAVLNGAITMESGVIVVTASENNDRHNIKKCLTRNSLAVGLNRVPVQILGKDLPMVFDERAITELCSEFVLELNAKDALIRDLADRLEKIKGIINEPRGERE